MFQIVFTFQEKVQEYVIFSVRIICQVCILDHRKSFLQSISRENDFKTWSVAVSTLDALFTKLKR